MFSAFFLPLWGTPPPQDYMNSTKLMGVVSYWSRKSRYPEIAIRGCAFKDPLYISDASVESTKTKLTTAHSGLETDLYDCIFFTEHVTNKQSHVFEFYVTDRQIAHTNKKDDFGVSTDLKNILILV